MGCVAMSANFSDRARDLIAASRVSAALLLPRYSVYLTLNGLLCFVYFAPRPILCSFNRRARSLVMPVYRLLSDTLQDVDDPLHFAGSTLFEAAGR